MQKLLVSFAVLTIAGCGGGGSGPDTPSLPPGAVALRTSAEKTGVEIAEVAARVNELLPLFLDPTGPEAVAAGIVLTKDDGPGAEPNTYDFGAPLDWDGDGTTDSQSSGRAVLSTDLASGVGPGFRAEVDFTVDVKSGEGALTGHLDFVYGLLGTEASGNAQMTKAADSSSVRLVIRPETPLSLRSPGPDAAANLCRLSAQGPVEVTAVGLEGIYAAVWRFLSGAATVSVEGAHFTDPADARTDIPGSSFAVGPCAGGVDDWAGVFLLDWSCDPPEAGQSRLTITRTGATTIHIRDESPPGSGDFIEFDAAIDPANPHVARGTFTDTDGGGTYNESFVWTLNTAGTEFTQRSVYQYPGGAGGICGGTARRE